ncbi:MAG: DNA polymerase I [SAR202 cluster bacterium]|nr:DNA polymerase I [SAR202 cluster bacterium]
MTLPGGKNALFGDTPKLILIDGHAMVHRAWHAIQQPLTIRTTGEDVRAVYGFTNSLLSSLKDLRPTHAAIAFDLPAPTFRHTQFAEYKAHRPPSPPELRAQFTRVRKLMQAFKVPVFEIAGFEADDVIGTLSRQAEEQKIETIILTGDSDTLQLVSPWVKVLMNRNVQERVMFDENKVRERYGGLGPEAVADYKALTGDTSDNIPGVPGIGPKTAQKLLLDYKSIEGIYAHLDEVKPPKAQQSLRDNREGAQRGKMLTTIVREAPVELDREKVRFWQYDRKEIVELLTEMEFFSVVPRIPDPKGDPAPVAAPTGQASLFDTADTSGQIAAVERAPRQAKYTIVDTLEKLDAMMKELDSPLGFAFDTETTALGAMEASLVGLSFANTSNEGWYVPVGHKAGTQIPMGEALERLKPVLANDHVPKYAHNANYDLTVLENHGVRVAGLVFDTMLGAHLVGRKAIGLKALALEMLGVEMTEIAALIGTGRKQITMADVEIQKAADYAAADADMTAQLKPLLEKEVAEKGARKALETMEMPLVPVLVKMQVNGVAIDSALLGEMAKELAAQIGEYETEIYQTVGHSFNIASSQQLGDVLFKELRLPETKKTKTGSFTTDAQALESLKQMIDSGTAAANVDPKAYKVLDLVLEYRQVTKLKSTYVDSLPEMVNKTTGLIHTSYHQAGSATGRVSSNEPNIQNIPIRTELGRRVRKAFIARAPGRTLLGADYSQIELRVLAHLSQDPGLLAAFKSGQDIHNATATMMFNVEPKQVTAEMRRIAKVLNFGVIYGLSPFGISQQTGINADEGKRFIDTYFGRYPGIREYIDRMKHQVRRTGYVETLMGRRRYIRR